MFTDFGCGLQFPAFWTSKHDMDEAVSSIATEMGVAQLLSMYAELAYEALM